MSCIRREHSNTDASAQFAHDSSGYVTRVDARSGIINFSLYYIESVQCVKKKSGIHHCVESWTAFPVSTFLPPAFLQSSIMLSSSLPQAFIESATIIPPANLLKAQVQIQLHVSTWQFSPDKQHLCWSGHLVHATPPYNRTRCSCALRVSSQPPPTPPSCPPWSRLYKSMSCTHRDVVTKNKNYLLFEVHGCMIRLFSSIRTHSSVNTIFRNARN